jgi:ligand-binding sensor domain-containing protein
MSRLFPSTWIIIFCGLLTTGSWSQSESLLKNLPQLIPFELPGGTPGNMVQCIVQDSTGFMWFGSQNGLHRFDGHWFTTYRHDPDDSTSISSSYIECLYVDHHGRLWAGTYGNGLNVFDSETETFRRYRHEPGNPFSLSSDTINVIVEDHQEVIWVGTHRGVNQLDPETGRWKPYRHIPGDTTSLSYDVVRALYVDLEGTLWVGTGWEWETDNDSNTPFRGGLNRFNP